MAIEHLDDSSPGIVLGIQGFSSGQGVHMKEMSVSISDASLRPFTVLKIQGKQSSSGNMNLLPFRLSNVS
jgi:hypothetical protein